MVSNSGISVTYTNGVVKPDHRLNLPEGTRLCAVIRPAPAPPDPDAAANAMDTIRRIAASGAYRSGGRKFTRDEMHERD
jgi:predicted DNA-binding antitoxin AbrB/MazE fold protein